MALGVSTKTNDPKGLSMRDSKVFKSLHFAWEDKNVPLSQEGQTILELALKNQIDLDHSCGGNGTCGTCRVFVDVPEGQTLPERDEVEHEMAVDRGFKDNERLACQTRAHSGMIVRKS